jgi:hypothetical protein
MKPLYRQNNPSSRNHKTLHAITAFHSPFFSRRFLHQHSQSPTKSMDYNFVPFCELFADGNRIPDFGCILDFTFRVDVLDDQTGSAHHGLFTIPGFHAHGLKDFEIDKKANPADYQINRHRGVKRQYPENR